jgi:hypothetical protein
MKYKVEVEGYKKKVSELHEEKILQNILLNKKSL